ncbi:MAG: methyltransferase domain-containing protein [Spirochaetales bacterium]|jgi:cyclopropane fatty-acyl-phospholipid synthase-like methyltransferase|nr:methyltransferase domain-containing protein [Spirochaetales bacterium]
MNKSEVVNTARTYYNSDDAESFYSIIWGGEDIHIGLYNSETDAIFDASRRTVEKIAACLKLDESKSVLDIGAGYGGSGRYMAEKFGCSVECLNLSEAQNKRNRKLNNEQGLEKLVSVTDGSFENLPYKEDFYDVVWSQDAILHSGNRARVIQEAHRVMKPGGEFIFTDIMQSDDCPDGVLQPILDRIHLATLGSPAFYRQETKKLGMEEVQFIDISEQLSNHYSHVLQEIKNRRDEIGKVCSNDYIERMMVGLEYWVNGGRKGYLKWGIFHFKK